MRSGVEGQSDLMKLLQVRRFNLRMVLTAVLLMILALVSFADGQKSTHKKKKRKPPVVTTKQDPAMTDPIIVSRASDYQNQSPVVPPANDAPVAQTADTDRDKQLADLSARIKQLESEMKNGYDEKQKRLLLNLDILTRAEQRAESLRKQRFELIEKENQIQWRLDQIEIDIRPETIERSVAVAGSLRPEELRDSRRKSLESERKNLQALLTQVQTTRATLDDSVGKSEQLVQKLRAKLEGDIDKTLDDGKPDNEQ